MLYFLYGNRAYVKNESTRIKNALLKKRPDAISFTFDSETGADLEELTGGQGLFQSRYIVELDGLFASGFFPNEKEAAESMQASENIFLVLEEKLPKKTLEHLKKHAERTAEEKTIAVKEKKEFSAFYLSDALAERDKKKLWTLYREAVERRYRIEELHGILFWQAKMIVLAHTTKSAEEAGVKQYPYTKAKAATKKYSLKEATELLHRFTEAIREGRSGKMSLEHALERVILGL